MTDRKQLTGLMISAINEGVWEAFQKAGIPQRVYQQLTLSPAWRKARREQVAAKLAQIKPPKQAEKVTNEK